MASDEIVWQIINQQFCAFKIKTTKGQNFCRNEYNVTGLCNRMSCPLANSRYATVRQENGVLYLYMKTIERAHMPSKLWERIKLSEDYARSLEQIDERLLYWPKYLSHKCKQRMTRLAQVALRSRRLAKEDERMGETIVGKAAPKVKRREATRERKALAAAKLEKQIEKELIERLRSGAYGEAPLNVEEGIWKKVLRGLERGGDAERDVDEEEEMEGELEDEEDYDEDEEIEYVSGDEELEEEAENDLNDIEEWIGSGASDFEDDDDEGDSSDEESDDEEEAPKSKKGPVAPVDPKKRKRDAPAPKSRKRGARVEIEYEEERALPSAKDLAF